MQVLKILLILDTLAIISANSNPNKLENTIVLNRKDQCVFCSIDHISILKNAHGNYLSPQKAY